MRIGIDARELTGHPTGVGRYLSGLLRQWAGPMGRGREFVLYAHRPLPPASGFDSRIIPGAGGTSWEQLALAMRLRQDRIEAFFAPGYTAPILSGVPTTVAIHDVSFFAHPEWFSSREGARRRFIARRVAAQARAVITISEFSKRELHHYIGASRGKVRVIPPGIDRPAGRATTSGHSAVLCVGSIFNRRNIPQLIAAVSRLQHTHPDVSLDLVGDNRTRPPIDILSLMQSQPGRDRLRWHRYVSDDELTALYLDARAFAFLSEYEGLGLTPLEALTVGVPAVLLDTPVARESCGEAALYVPHGDVAATADALAALLFDAPTRDRLLSLAPAVLARYDWATAAQRTLATIEGA